VSLFVGVDGSPSNNVAWAEDYLRAKWHLDPFSRLATIHQFSVIVCCDQTAGWVRISLGTEVALGPGHIVLDGDPDPPPQQS